MHFLVSFCLINMFTMCTDSSELLNCPIWTYPSHSGNKCIRGDDLDHVILCNPETLTVRFTVRSFCFKSFNSNHGVNMTLLGTCPYPLFLILFTFILVKLHNNFAFVVWLWKLFYIICLADFRRQWNIRDCLVHAFATFIVLFYVKIFNTSCELLIPSQLYDMHKNHILKAYWYYDGRVDMTSKGFIPLLVLALFMLLFFNVLPLALLALYPFKRFQRLLNFCLSPNCRLVLQIYMDSFHSCYEDTSHDYRNLAVLYLAVRFLNLLVVSVFNFTLYLPAATLVFVFTLALVEKFQPYKNKRNNVVDIILLLITINGFISSTMYNVGLFMYPKWLCRIILLSFLS